jgi:D-alanyl-D-alanine dipeptidase
MGIRHIAAIISLISSIASAASETQYLTPPDTPVQEESLPIPDASDMVEILDFIPDIQVELRYATENNFTGKQIYDFTDARLRYGTVLKLKAAQEQLQQEGLSLLIWDAYRPVSAQFNLWNVCPDPVYVANPNTGYSSHSQGNTIDVTLIQVSGAPVQMPTDFDNFTARADRNYEDCTPEETANAQKLENIMIQAGFKPYFGEWWHYSDTDSYPVETEP